MKNETVTYFLLVSKSAQSLITIYQELSNIKVADSDLRLV